MLNQAAREQPCEPLIIWGAGGHALVVADIIRLVNCYNTVGLLDNLHPERAGSVFGGIAILGGSEQLAGLKERGISSVIVGFGECAARLEVAELLTTHGFNLARAIHPSAVVAADVTIGEGTVLVAGSVINPASKVGENVIVNTCASIDHECVIGDGAHIAPGARLAARVSIGRGTFVGLGALVKEGVRIGASTMIGAGSVVLQDIPDGVLAYGTPARPVRRLTSTS